MKINAIKQVRSGKNIHFITDEIQEYDLNSILELGERGALENATVVTTKTGKQYLRSKANASTFDNLDRVAITCNEKDYLLFDRKHIYLKAQNGRVKKQWVATPLEPSHKNEMYGRGNFYIHGGNEPGSEGCIDLTNKNQNFHTFLRLYKRDIKLIVKY